MGGKRPHNERLQRTNHRVTEFTANNRSSSRNCCCCCRSMLVTISGHSECLRCFSYLGRCISCSFYLYLRWIHSNAIWWWCRRVVFRHEKLLGAYVFSQHCSRDETWECDGWMSAEPSTDAVRRWDLIRTNLKKLVWNVFNTLFEMIFHA